MIKTVLLLIGLLCCLTGFPQPKDKWQLYSVSSSVKDSFLFYLKLAKANELQRQNDSGDLSTYKIPYKTEMPEENDTEDLPAIIIPYQLGDSIFKDPNGAAGVIECQCSFEKDTLNIAIGIGFYSGAFWVARATKNLSDSYFAVWSDEPVLKKGTDKEWQEEIELQASNFKLILSKKHPFKIDDTIYGIWEAEYPEYYEKEEDKTRIMKNKLKIYFSCKIDVKIF